MAKRPRSIRTYKGKKTVSWTRRICRWTVKTILAFLIMTALWVLAYRFLNPPLTVTMVEDLVAGRGAARSWMPIGQIDRDMVRAAIAAEDGKFCSHHGFDVQAMENAIKRNASGGRIRGGSTISQQAAKNAFLWQGGGYARKAIEAWFTFLVEHFWGKRRIMEVYLNLAETGFGTYGVNAASQRYFGHDASAMSRTEAARIAAVLPLPKRRGAIAPKGFTRRYGNIIAARISTVARDDLDGCIYQGTAPPAKRAVQPVVRKARPVPGAEFESSRSVVNWQASQEPSQVDPELPPESSSTPPEAGNNS